MDRTGWTYMGCLEGKYKQMEQQWSRNLDELWPLPQ